MSEADPAQTEPAAPPTAEPAADDAPESTDASGDKLVLCPYCGAAQRGGQRCHTCGGLFEQLSQKATQIAMGPWYIRDKANPFRPGCSYEVIRKMVASGRIKPTTVIRGPTTRQFWSIARNVEGVAHLLGYCHHCGAHIDPNDTSCEICGASFKPIEMRNELGLRFRTTAEVEQAQRELDAEVSAATGVAPAPRKPRPRASLDASDAASAKKKGAGLLEDVLEEEAADNPAAPAGASLSAFETEDARDAPVTDADDRAAASGGVAISPAVWVLATLNVVAIIAVVLLYLWVQQG